MVNGFLLSVNQVVRVVEDFYGKIEGVQVVDLGCRNHTKIKVKVSENHVRNEIFVVGNVKNTHNDVLITKTIKMRVFNLVNVD